MPRPKQPEKIAKGIFLTGQKDLSHSTEFENTVKEVLSSFKRLNNLNEEQKRKLIRKLASISWDVFNIDISKLPLVLNDKNNEPLKDKNGQEKRLKLKSFRKNLFCLGVISIWTEINLNNSLYENENGASLLVDFTNHLAERISLKSNKSLYNNLRKAKKYSVKIL